MINNVHSMLFIQIICFYLIYRFKTTLMLNLSGKIAVVCSYSSLEWTDMKMNFSIC